MMAFWARGKRRGPEPPGGSGAAGSPPYGQVSLEFLIIFAITLVVLLVFLTLSQQETADVNRAKVRSDALNSLADLSSASKEVYAQGAGAKKQVMIKIPGGYEAGNSYVANRTIKMRVAGSDYLETTSFDLRGGLPQTAGTHWVWVISEGSRVTIGNVMLSLDKVSISVLMERNQSRNDTVTVTNMWNSPINVSLSVNWINTNVTLETVPTVFELDPLESQPVRLGFYADPRAVGYYTGNIIVTGNDGTTTETATLPMTVEVIGFGVGIPPALRVTPSVLNASMQMNSTITRAFTACTNAYTKLDDVLVAPSLGDPGNWVGGPIGLGAMGYDECRSFNLNVSVPMGTPFGLYTGYVLFDGQGMDPPVQAATGITIAVGGTLDDNVGPDVTSVAKVPVRSLVHDDMTIFATGDDSLRGNSSILRCELNVDGGGWYIMNPVDGRYDKPAENVSYTFIGGVDFGVHTANIRCTDDRGNVGPTRAYQFKVMKPILFITQYTTWGWDDWDWITWLWLHNSFWGYDWDFDTASASSVQSGGTSLEMYTSVMLCEYVNGYGITPNLINYENAGGSVMLVGSSLQHGPKNLGFATGGNGKSDSSVTITDNTHYITQGYSTGSIQVMTLSTPIYKISDFTGQQLAKHPSGGNDTVMGVKRRFMLWGPTKPYRFVSDGIDITTNFVDYGISNSIKQ